MRAVHSPAWPGRGRVMSSLKVSVEELTGEFVQCDESEVVVEMGDVYHCIP